MDLWFGIKSPIGRGIGTAVAVSLGAGISFYQNHTPLWLAPVCGLVAGIGINFITKSQRDKAQGS